MTGKQPTNILLIQADQHRFDCLGVNGHPLVKTPNLDRLAAEGVNFTHAFTAIPVCAPARTSLMNGRWPHQHLAIANHGTEAPRPAVDGLPTFSEQLRGAGYWLGHLGTWDVHPEKDSTTYGFHEFVSAAAYTAWRAAEGLPPRPAENGFYGECDPHITPEQSRLAWGADQILRMLPADGKNSTPFFIRWDPSEPHLPNVVPEPYCSQYAPADIAPWPSVPDPLEGKPYMQAQQRRSWKLTDWTWADWSPIVARYLGEITLLDAQVGRILDALDERGLTGSTLVIYTSDHGDLCGGHGMIDKHYIMYDDVVRIPLIARWPGHIAPGRQCDAFVSTSVDLPPTFCEVADVAVPETFQGTSVRALLEGEETNGRTDIYSTYHGNQFGLYSQRMVRDHRWKYVWNATAEDELYDLQSDPGEIRNRATDADCGQELVRLRQRLVAWMEESRDPLLNFWTRAQLLEGLTV